MSAHQYEDSIRTDASVVDDSEFVFDDVRV